MYSFSYIDVQNVGIKNNINDSDKILAKPELSTEKNLVEVIAKSQEKLQLELVSQINNHPAIQQISEFLKYQKDDQEEYHPSEKIILWTKGKWILTEKL